MKQTFAEEKKLFVCLLKSIQSCGQFPWRGLLISISNGTDGFL